MKTDFRLITPVLVLLIFGAAALAHHGTFVSYDSDHPVTMKGP
jgi:hypothetical protein